MLHRETFSIGEETQKSKVCHWTIFPMSRMITKSIRNIHISMIWWKLKMVKSVNTIYPTSIFPPQFPHSFVLFLNYLTFVKQRWLLPNLIQPQAVYMLVLRKFVMWLVKATHFCDGSHQSEVDFTQHKHRNSLWLHLILVLVAPPPHVRSPFYMGNSAFVSWTFNQIKKKLLFWGWIP